MECDCNVCKECEAPIVTVVIKNKDIKKLSRIQKEYIENEVRKLGYKIAIVELPTNDIENFPEGNIYYLLDLIDDPIVSINA